MNSYKKGSNFIIIIFVVLILLPSFILVPVTNFILNNGGAAFLELPIFVKISAFIASFSTMLGIFTIYSQIEKDKRVNSSRFLVDLNDSLMSFESTRNVYKKLLDLEDKKYDKKLYEKAFKSDEDRYDIVQYLNFFENIEFFIRKGVLKISEVNDLFSKRFFIIANNQYVQEIKLIKYDYSWRNIYRMARVLIEFKNDKGLEIPYKKFSLSKSKNYKKYSEGYFNYKSVKNNLFMIFILSSSIFTFLLFFILLYFKYPINNISSTIGSCGTIIGAFAIFFQHNTENNINKSRFFFELNKSFISKIEYKKVFVNASKNLYYNLPFNEKNNTIKKIDIASLFNYLTFFESINVMLENKGLNISDIYFLFNYRLFFVVNNPYVQNYILFRNKIFFKNIYKLHNKMLLFYQKNKDKYYMDYKDYSLEKVDNDYYKLIK